MEGSRLCVWEIGFETNDWKGLYCTVTVCLRYSENFRGSRWSLSTFPTIAVYNRDFTTNLKHRKHTGYSSMFSVILSHKVSIPLLSSVSKVSWNRGSELAYKEMNEVYAYSRFVHHGQNSRLVHGLRISRWSIQHIKNIYKDWNWLKSFFNIKITSNF